MKLIRNPFFVLDFMKWHTIFYRYIFLKEMSCAGLFGDSEEGRGSRCVEERGKTYR